LETTGKKLIDRTGSIAVQVEIDWDSELITVSVDKTTNVATILYALLMGYNSVYLSSSEEFDKPEGTVLQ